MRSDCIKQICGCFLWIMIQSNPGICLENLALQKPAWASSVLPDLPYSKPENAVAGTHGSDYLNEDCMHTNFGDALPWLIVDLLGRYYVHNVTIYNRQDCCADRLHDFVVEVFETNPTRCASAQASVCKTYPGVFGSVETLVCDEPVLGRFVRLTKPNPVVITEGDDLLSVCELEVFGKREECQPSYITTASQRLVSSAVSTLSASFRLLCVVECEMSRACVGVNYNSGTGVCELLTRPEPNDAVSSHSDWVYSGHDLC